MPESHHGSCRRQLEWKRFREFRVRVWRSVGWNAGKRHITRRKSQSVEKCLFSLAQCGQLDGRRPPDSTELASADKRSVKGPSVNKETHQIFAFYRFCFVDTITDGSADSSSTSTIEIRVIVHVRPPNVPAVHVTPSNVGKRLLKITDNSFVRFNAFIRSKIGNLYVYWQLFRRPGMLTI